ESIPVLLDEPPEVRRAPEHLLRGIVHDLRLVTFRRGAVDLGSDLAIGYQQIERHGRGKLSFPVLAGYLDVCRPKPPGAVRSPPAEHRPHDLPLPGLQPERLSRPLALVVPAKPLDELDHPVGRSLVPPEPVRLALLEGACGPAFEVPDLPLVGEPLQLPQRTGRDHAHARFLPPKRKSAAVSASCFGVALTSGRALGKGPKSAPRRRASARALSM